MPALTEVMLKLIVSRPGAALALTIACRSDPAPLSAVVVTNFVGPYSEQIRVVGEAAKPQSLPYRQNMTLLDVMIAVGGLTDFAAGNSATILRGGAQGTQYSVRLKDLIRRGDVSANVEMKPGDILIIPQSFF